MNEIQVFTHPDFGSLEVWIGPDGKAWFPATESAELLKYKNPQDAVRSHCMEAGCAFRSVSYPSGVKQKKYINRPNLSRLIARSHLPDAVRFESWIFDDVLESVFDHGMYATPQTVEAMLDDPDTMIRILQAYKAERTKSKTLEGQVARKDQIIGELKPKADYTDQILRSNGLVTITQIAKDYGMSGQAMNVKLRELGVQFKESDQWLLYREHHGMGYTHSETVPYMRSDGSTGSKMHTKWTQKGRLFLYGLLKTNGILPMIERDQAELSAAGEG